MAKSLESRLHEAEIKTAYWHDMKNDPQALKDLGKTQHEAECLEQYFEGLADGLCEVRREKK